MLKISADDGSHSSTFSKESIGLDLGALGSAELYSEPDGIANVDKRWYSAGAFQVG
jgi:hypothetical protein